MTSRRDQFGKEKFFQFISFPNIFPHDLNAVDIFCLHLVENRIFNNKKKGKTEERNEIKWIDRALISFKRWNKGHIVDLAGRPDVESLPIEQRVVKRRNTGQTLSSPLNIDSGWSIDS